MITLELTIKYTLQLLAKRVKRVIWPNPARGANYRGRHFSGTVALAATALQIETPRFVIVYFVC